MAGLPSGTVTFLFTDIEGGTRRREHDPTAMQIAQARYETILRRAIEANEGYAYKIVSDTFQAAFSTAPQALQAALDAQRALHAEPWGEAGELRVRMALHTGIVEEREGDYAGPMLNRVARLLAVGHGGQALLTTATQGLVQDSLPAGVSLRDLGEHYLKDLTRPEHIFQLVNPDLPAEFPPLRTPEGRPNNLPVQGTALVGRDKEIEACCLLLRRDDVSLLTLTGVGGVGKTRLAQQVGADLLDDFRDGVFFVDLAPITDPGLVVSDISGALGIRDISGQPPIDALKGYLLDKQILLVLDNFEQVLQAATIVSELLMSAPRLKALVTSRATLHLSMEQEVVVSPLALPDPRQSLELGVLLRYEAIELFVARAQAVKPDFKLEASNAQVVAEICLRLDGLPLAIELAAARIKILSPQALSARLVGTLQLLSGGAADQPARQQTLRNTIEWSYNLLNEGEQKLFSCSAVFSGGGALEAIEAVFRGVEVLDGLASLVDKSLLSQREGIANEPRFWLLQTIREYALQRLEESRAPESHSAEAQQTWRRHAEFFLALAEKAAPHLAESDQSEWLARLEEEHDNLRSALNWWVKSGETEPALRLGAAIWRFWFIRGYLTEGRERLAELRALPVPQPEPASHKLARARVLGGSAFLEFYHPRPDLEAARALCEESLALSREIGDKWGISRSLSRLGVVAYFDEDFANAGVMLEESVAVGRAIGDMGGIAWSLYLLGLVVREQSDHTRARSLTEQALAIQKELGNKHNMAYSLAALGTLAAD
ncbi:MAG: ATP-binding protein, partial [Chloroflexia bacterium]